MAVAASDIIKYGCANEALSDGDAAGGAIDTTVGFLDGIILSSEERLEVVSSSASDTQLLTVRGRGFGGYPITEVVRLTGTTLAYCKLEFERIVDLELSSAAVGSISVRQQSDSAVLDTITAGYTRLTSLFKWAYQSETDEITRYEKFFFKNTHATDGLTGAAVALWVEGSGYLSIGVDPTVDGTVSVADRTTAPAGVTFEDTLQTEVSVGSLAAGEAIGVWIKQVLPAGFLPSAMVTVANAAFKPVLLNTVP